VQIWKLNITIPKKQAGFFKGYEESTKRTLKCYYWAGVHCLANKLSCINCVQEGWGIVCPTRFYEQNYSFLPRNENSPTFFSLQNATKIWGF
jgi:hypothetical protein